MNDDTYSPEQIAAITDYVDVEAPPSDIASHFIPGTNQTIPINIVVERYRKGLAPFIIVTGGVNRHNGVVEGQEFHRQLVKSGVKVSAIRCENRSENTWQNVEFALPHLREALDLVSPITVVCKWYHRRVIHCLRTLLPEIGPVYAITFEPIYSGEPITRTNWMSHPDGKRRVLREWQEVSRRISDQSFVELTRTGDAWR